ncbi:MAG: heavy metal translocating P-type ATPase [Sulfuritalea sp.]|nr:heavy metal translocating P-type ATPase [Sulfuritalea sp.]MBN8475569.1 heavy metal translocating P-type ATPase [Sulfuritalea sp.]
MADQSCYHCGLPIPAGADFPVEIDQTRREMCCAGCQAVAQAIVGNGLGDYYRHRDALPESPREALPQVLADFGLFDHPDVQKNFVRRAEGAAGEHEREAALILEGITCAACVWLNESHVRRQPGVTSVDINYTTRRARVRWDQRATRLSAILEAISTIGYRAHPYDIGRAEELAQKERKTALWRLFVAGFGMMQVMMYAVPVYLADGDMTPDIEQLMRWASLILTLPVIGYSAAPFFVSAWRDLKLQRVGMDVPVALGVGAAFAASVWATLIAAGEVYFDSVTMFVFFLLSGRYLEMMARQRAARSVETLARAIPAFATRLSGWPGNAGEADGERVAVARLNVGDTVQVKPGETIPADGRVLDGASAADESLLTGESRPVPKRVGDALIGGSVNTASPLVMRIERVGESTRVAAIQRLMERAAAEKPRLVEMADRVAGRFIVALLLLAVATALAWWWLDPSRALWIFVAVLVVSCPCALSLATPAALTVATGALAARGVLVTRGHAIEALARADRFIFDKTGTLTVGQMDLVEVNPVRGEAGFALSTAAALERGSEHPIARALIAGGADAGLVASSVRATAGAGVEGLIDGRPWRLGRPEFVAAIHGLAVPLEFESKVGAGDTVVALGNADGWQAFFRLSDSLRSEASAMTAGLSAAGIKLSIFSGDATAAAKRVGAALGIADARGGLSPEDKHAALKALQDAGETVAMVGDGVNDAPVLARAQVSIAMGGGADLARANADVVLLGNDLRALPPGLALARRTVRIVKQNLVWAFAYNFLAIPLAMAGWVTPWMAGIGMSASSLLVVLNALRLQRR